MISDKLKKPIKIKDTINYLKKIILIFYLLKLFIFQTGLNNIILVLYVLIYFK